MQPCPLAAVILSPHTMEGNVCHLYHSPLFPFIAPFLCLFPELSQLHGPKTQYPFHTQSGVCFSSVLILIFEAHLKFLDWQKKKFACIFLPADLTQICSFTL